jgi:hypothetical protein
MGKIRKDFRPALMKKDGGFLLIDEENCWNKKGL